MGMTPAPPKPQGNRNPDLPEVLIILLISVGILIFVFWISTQFLGASTFQNLPPWLMAVFKNVWAAVGTGATGIGLALLKAFQNRGQPQPNYLKYIGLCVLGLLLIIFVLIKMGTPKSHGPYPRPPNTTPIDYNKSGRTDFDLENSLPDSLRYRLQGSFTVQDGVLSGHLGSGRVEVPHVLPEMFPRDVTRISFRACYNDPTAPELVRSIFPPTAKTRNSVDVSLLLTPDATYTLQPADFSFDLPVANHVFTAWLCAALKAGPGEFPAE